ncbi:hypothetical protein CVT26_015246 [Gymnopilus dilepis]|uniref:ATP-dependent DNA helicase n=1 Tax=Gymnopilus dilepis TaxID=231916 RepID=A0A409W9X9_9AGAR|nr:hypothetical protein CVT26_015246 [Gymnopilus dilepis]
MTSVKLDDRRRQASTRCLTEEPMEEDCSSDEDNNSTDHLRVLDDETRLKIIQEWEAEMAFDKIELVVCSVCGTRTKRRETNTVHGTAVDLALLRNDELPERVRPSTYNFVAYNRAVLNPKGLLNVHEVGKMIICHRCYDTLRSGRMPKFALCNWLYYGRAELPEEIKRAFGESSMFERMLISRARSNSICCKFNVSGEERKSKRNEGMQKGIRGNIMVAPLDAIRLHAILPPKIDHKDTMTAVVVGDKFPTKDTISKLGPVLVRKSRIKTLLEFLMSNNSHYAPSDELVYSQENLDAIHDSTEGAEVPKTVSIGHLREHDGLESVNSDYTPRNEDEWLKDEHLQELMMENVGYTEGDNSPEAYSAMKVLALQRCLSGKPFVATGSGNRLMPDFNNPSILTWLFPHLDPWGIGGFHESRRKIKLSMREQLCHLLNSDDVCFNEDPEFPFTFYNMDIKGEVCRTVRYRVPKDEQARLIEELQSINTNELRSLSCAIEKNPMFKPDDPEQKRIMALLRRVSMSTPSLPGSNGYKMTMRRNVRAIINARGAPTLFITLNPSDVHNPIVRILGGKYDEIDVMLDGEDIQSWRRKVYAAKNPAACAKFFDLMITTFIKVVLGYDKGEPGLYGYCDAYYGMVEAQGKGTLHLHLLVWLRGHLSPEMLRTKLSSSKEYRDKFVGWIESIIMNEFPVLQDNRADDPSRIKRVRSKELGEPHPGTIAGPTIHDGGWTCMSEFWPAYKEHLIRLLNEYNWHEHTSTCWKYLKQGEEKSDSNCRMRMDGKIHPTTIVDTETGHFQLRRLHPWLSSFTDVVTYLLKCNMNIQFIGTGLEAKAFIYYVTDYVTKACLPLHAGLAAVAYALTKINELAKERGDQAEGFFTSALIKFVNSMMGKHEISQQQVMSYLVGGGDCYTSEKFQNLHLSAFLKYVAVQELESGIETKADNDTQPGEENVYIAVDQDGVRADSQVLDYLFRPAGEPYESMNLYDFTARTCKVKERKTDGQINPRQAFSSWSHPQRSTHRISMRSKPVLPVILGPSLPVVKADEKRPDSWVKTMLILFKPWRTFEDLKKGGQSWSDAYEAYENSGLKKRSSKIMKNMQLLSECADARFKGFGEADVPGQLETQDGQESDQDEPNVDRLFEDENGDIQQWKAKYCSEAFSRFQGQNHEGDDFMMPDGLQELSKEEFGKEIVNALDFCLQSARQVQDDVVIEEAVSKPSKEEIAVHCAIMKRKRKRVTRDDEDDVLEAPVNKKRREQPFVDIKTIPIYAVNNQARYERILESIVEEMNLKSNKEQLEAFLAVAKHVGERDPDQLLMFVSGVGGTGKSHVIKSVVRLFEVINRRKSLLLGAPTGIAAILIGGSTLHSLILETPNVEGKKNITKLARIWNGVTYLIIDEVSMLSAAFLNKLSEVMKQAKGDDPRKSCQIFGGVNVIFMGDFCQLKPPGDAALFSSRVIKQLTNNAGGKDHVSAMNGIFTWRQVTRIVELLKNCRHAADVRYSEFLSRLRVGKCMDPRVHGDSDVDDYRYIQSRLLTNIIKTNPEELKHFVDAPFIVGTKAIRDVLNARMASFHASRMRKELHVYYSKDNMNKRSIPTGRAEYLWDLDASHSRDAIGRLPMFEGMKVMITENIAFDSKVVNGTEGVIKTIVYEEDDQGRRFATVAYVHIPGIGFHVDGLDEDVVPIFPVKTSIKLLNPSIIGLNIKSFSRCQLPLLPAYAYTDYKSQGRTLTRAIVDIWSAKSQGVYVMLSRVTSLSGVAILRWFPPSKIYQRLSEELRVELHRLNLQH